MTYYDDELYHYDDELYHYGVKGMKWGVRRFRRNVSNGVSRIRRKGQKFYNKHRRAINTAAGIAGAAALGYGAYRLDKATGGRGARAAANLYRNAGVYGRQGAERIRSGAHKLHSKYRNTATYQQLSRKTAGARKKIGSAIGGAYGAGSKYAKSAYNSAKKKAGSLYTSARNSNFGVKSRQILERAGSYGHKVKSKFTNTVPYQQMSRAAGSGVNWVKNQYKKRKKKRG